MLLHPDTAATATNLFFSCSYGYLNHPRQSLTPHRPHDWTSHTHPRAEGLATSSLDGNECCRCLVPPHSSGVWDSTGAIALPGFQRPQEFKSKGMSQLSSHAQLFSPAPTTARAIATKTTMASLSHSGTQGLPLVLSCVPSAQAVPRVSLSPQPGLNPGCHCPLSPG